MGTWDDYRPATNSRWFKAEDLPADGSVVQVRIARLSKEQVGEDNDEKSVLLVQDGAREGIVLNGTRFEMLREIFPDIPSPDHLCGKWIGLKRGRTRFAGKRVDCVDLVAVPQTEPEDTSTEIFN